MPIELVTSQCCIGSISRAELFATVRKCGYTHTELFATWGSAKFSEADTPASTNTGGVKVSAVHLPGDVEQAKRIIETAAACGIPQAIVHGAGAPAEATQWLKPLVVHGKKFNVDIVLTNHKGQSIDSPDDVRAAIAACGEDKPGVLFEAGQYWASGHDAIKLFAEFEQEISLIHVKDLNADGKSVQWGTGRCPLADFFRSVAESSYSGRIVVECEPHEPPEVVAGYLTEARKMALEWMKPVRSAK